VFAPHSAAPIVLATNVAETSLTVPGIRYVIDAGTARIKRYSFRSKVEQLPIEPVSQAAANQRAGRCGRVADGICIRLYDEADFAARPRFTEPEIVRSSLAGVILRMKSLNLGAVEDFPFLEAPPKRAIADGYQLLNELGATDDDNALDDHRPRAGEAAARSARRPHDPGGARARGAARGAGHRQLAERPGRARPAAGASAGRGPGARQVRRREVRVPRHPQAVGRGWRARAAATGNIASRAGSTSRSCATTSSRRAGCANGATSSPSCSRW
jgi:ATP-dependent helicase HrpA